MDTKFDTLDYWRIFFGAAKSDIFDVIEFAILVAASDCPKEFQTRRDRIAEKLYSCQITHGFGCDHVDPVVPEENYGEFKGGFGVDGGFEGAVSDGKVSKVISSSTEGFDDQSINCIYEEVDALIAEIEDKGQIVGEVLRIKEVLSNSQDESDGVLFESLRRLQLMELSVEILKETEIGKAVNIFRKRGTEKIRQLARVLINGWKKMVDEWVNATEAITGGSSNSVNPSVVDEDGLPSAPLDDGAFLTTSIELSQVCINPKFFDGIDDDGNLQNSEEFEKNDENTRKTTSKTHTSNRKFQNLHEASIPKGDKNQLRKQEILNKKTKPSNTDFEPGRLSNLSTENTAKGDTMLPQQLDVVLVQKKPLSSFQDKSKNSDESSILVKLEAAKRKLQEGYQKAEHAKKKRAIQVIDEGDLPKQGLGHINSHARINTHTRHWKMGCHSISKPKMEENLTPAYSN
ncbi:putative mediator of RNA polymerase II transcription subunit 26b [Tasmannia lanceolata]|uniref:putative mediator of RNA polymerase II transcription subunit 26b n=1 Tax=Tasmannia lanceolata TaxID=3420 RepID=UPI00406324EB